jgi:hypothetical protein
LTYDATDIAHVSYVDSTHNDLDYVNSMQRTPQIVDDGWRTSDEQTLDGLNSPVLHMVGASSSIQMVGGKIVIAYQDATTLQLRTASRAPMDTKWTTMTLAGHASPFKGAYGFYAGLRVADKRAVVSSYGINQQVDPPQLFVEVFVVDLGLIM